MSETESMPPPPAAKPAGDGSGGLAPLLNQFTRQILPSLNGAINTLHGASRGDPRLRAARGRLEQTVAQIRNLAFYAQHAADPAFAVRCRQDRLCLIPRLLEDALSFHQEAAQQARLRIELRHRRYLNAVHGNADLLRQVLINLFDNAIKYGLPDTELEVRNWHQKENGQIIIKLSGPGLGFAPEEDVFALGCRGVAARAKVPQGAGLGLTVSRLIVEQVFEGQLTLQYDSLNGVTSAEIRLPNGFVQEEVPPPPPPPAVRLPAPRPPPGPRREPPRQSGRPRG